MLQANGGCLCGAVRYRVAGIPVMVAVCHCRTCQRNNGSAFSTNVALPREAVVVEAETLSSYETRAGADALPFYRRFCSRCGSPVCAEGDAYPGIVFIKAGTLDDPTAVTPSVHIYCEDQLPWVPTTPGVARFAAGPES